MGVFDRMSGLYKSFINLNQPMNIQGSSQSSLENLEKSESVRGPKSTVENPLAFAEATQYKDRTYSMSYDMLQKMASRNAVVASIITTRVNQVSAFTRPARFDRSGIGYEISLRDPDASPSNEDKKSIIAIEEFLENTGYDNDNSRDDFDTFIRKIVRDRLTYDQTCFEIIPDRKGRPAKFIAVDASSIRIANENLDKEVSYKEAEIKKNEEIKYIQVVDGSIEAYYTANEMAFGISNPRTDLNTNGYGFSELEMLIHQVTSHLWAEQYNSRFFSQGGTTKGILNLKSTAENPISPQQLSAFKRQWISQVSGMTGAWKTPVVSVDGLEYLNVSQSNREMEFEKWMNYLINISSAVFQIDPSEINFPNRGGATGSSGGGLGEGGIEDRLKNSRDKGLRPLLRFIETLINRYIVSRFDTRFVFSFVGIDAKSESEIAELDSKRVKVWKTVNEIRKENDVEPIENGDVILDPSYIQFLGQQQQAQMMGAMDEGEDNDVEYDQDDNEDAEKSNKPDFRKSDSKFITFEFDDDDK